MIVENHYYVYCHKYRESQVIFYIGKGTRSRKNIIAGRSSAWECAAAKAEWESIILKEHLTEDEAYSFEAEMIEKYAGTVCNKRGQFKRVSLTFDELNSKFKISKDSPTGLINIMSGKVVGWKSPKGYLTETHGITIGVHRIIYFLHTGLLNFSLPVDHINGDCFDNTPENLRNVSISTNNRNRILSKTPLMYRYTMVDTRGWNLKYTDATGKRVTINFTDKVHGSERLAYEACFAHKKSICDLLLSLNYTERVIYAG